MAPSDTCDHLAPAAERDSTGSGPLVSEHRQGRLRSQSKIAYKRLARRTVGSLLLLMVVVLWTASSFLSSTIFADNTYSKPFFMTYVNTSIFTVSLIWIPTRHLFASKDRTRVLGQTVLEARSSSDLEEVEDSFLIPGGLEEISGGRGPLTSDSITEPTKVGFGAIGGSRQHAKQVEKVLSEWEIAKLALQFNVLWFGANYFSSACFEYTTVASSTIFTSTSSIWTLLFGTLVGGERFTLRKLLGTLTSLAGVILISRADASGETDKDRGSFPHKSSREIAIGDVLALASALLYGIYTIFMKKRIGDEAKINMPLFFGFVGLANMLLLWPGFFIFHFAGVERFQPPPTKRVTAIILINSIISLVSDYCWAYAVLLTSPLLVTVGLSLTIPLSLVGQMLINSQRSSVSYWIGAIIVFLSFLFINHESKGTKANREESGSSDGLTTERCNAD